MILVVRRRRPSFRDKVLRNTEVGAGLGDSLLDRRDRRVRYRLAPDAGDGELSVDAPSHSGRKRHLGFGASQERHGHSDRR